MLQINLLIKQAVSADACVHLSVVISHVGRFWPVSVLAPVEYNITVQLYRIRHCTVESFIQSVTLLHQAVSYIVDHTGACSPMTC